MKRKLWIAAAVILVLAGIAAAVLYCDHQWLPATCVDPSTCSLCEKTQGEALGHDWKAATCTEAETCTRCGMTQGKALGHDWLDISCTDPQTCRVCGLSVGQTLPHSWQSATCLEPETCGDCGITQGEALGHDWLAATCTSPETCSRCGMTQGQPLPHTWVEATCVASQTCSVCGQTQGDPLPDHAWAAATCAAAKTCTVCGKTEGQPLTTHSWKSATCTKAQTCTVCGKTQGNALGHTWKAATCSTAKTCTRCGTTSGGALGHNFAASTDGVNKTCNTCGQTVKIKYVAITFDDGPSGKITQRLLDGLADRGAKATFFICGYRIETYGDYPQRILDGGHEIGLHTYNHATLTKLDAAGIRRELQDLLNILPAGCNVTLMRPPGGNYNNTVKQVCGDMGLSIIMWSVDTRDWETNNASTVTSRIVSKAYDGSIILLHDLKSSSVTAALNAIDILQAQGYEFVTVSELARIKGYTLTAGEVYNSLK